MNCAAALTPLSPALAALGDLGELDVTRGSSPLPPHLRVHPQGFRILNKESALERNMRSYFRLPQPPNAATREERRRLRRTVQRAEREEAERRARVTGGQDGVVLDGFLLLSACGVEEPEEVTQVSLQSSQLAGSIAEDLQYFTRLTSLDMSDNQLRLGDVLSFPALETVHLVCNGIHSLADMEQVGSSSLATVTALDIAYNHIPAHHLGYLAAFTALQQVDLSHNCLRTLPMDLSGLTRVTHLALEANELTTPNIFYALASMPALVEANLTRNRLASVPPLDPESCRAAGCACPAPFAALQVLTLTANRFPSAASLLSLAALHGTLRRLNVAENPFVADRPQRRAELQRGLDEAVVDAYYAAFLPDPASPEGLVDTWHRETWVRYIPRPPRDADAAERAHRTASSSYHTAVPTPSGAASSAAEPSSPSSIDHNGADAGDSTRLPTPEEYLAAHRIVVQTPGSATAVPPKQPTQFFYSAAFLQSAQGARDATPLVTLPSYKEFMDVYRVVGRRRPEGQRRGSRGTPSRTAVARAAAAAAAARTVPPSPPARLPYLASLPSSPSLECLGRSAPLAPRPAGAADMGEAPTVLDGDGFFLTGLAAPSRQAAAKDRRETAAPGVAAALAAFDAPEVPEVVPARASTSTPPRPPRSVLSPATANVHTAMSELRAMLRKPLPSLPYDAARYKQTTS